MKVLIIGCNGQLGRDLMGQAQARGWEAAGADLPELDITKAASVAHIFERCGAVGAVINSAAYTAVDAAESNAETAFAVNRDGVRILAQTCEQRKAPLIHISTDYVFDGLKTSPYLPADEINPMGVYARSKAEGEEELRRHLTRHVIVRTSWLFGLHGPNFVKTMLRLGKERDILRVVDDQVGCPTYAGDLAGALLDIAAYIQHKSDGWGTYHYCNEVPVTWYAFTRRILALARTYEQFMVNQIVPILTAHYPTPAQRPPYSVLDCDSLEARFGISRRPWEKALREMLSRLYEEQKPEG
ncbi:MAG: dTDP-4-dehydrorhamnose reductase [Desulfobacteraceae bacterium]|nr:dTDP-4-dehydrorhamnose reductase [Desulfobacteraceae bacterium]